MGPILLEPRYISPIWAGTRIAQIRGIKDSDAENNYGEAFDVSSHPTTTGVVANGPCAGMIFKDFLASHHDEVMGSLVDDDILQVTWMAPVDNLSVQVHPDEEYARVTDGDHGKTEAWYIAEASKGCSLISGSSTCDLDELRKAAEDDSIGYRLSKRMAVREGDFVLVPAGTMHALGAGCLAVEIGTFGNLTYRLCDWGRGREIHIDKALDVLKPEQEATATHLGPYSVPILNRVSTGIDCDMFHSNVIDVADAFETQTEGRYHIVTCVAGTAHVRCEGETIELGYTRSAVIPATAGAYTVEGPCRFLQSFRPHKRS